ncbi:MAG: (d)CMP kinase [Chloroflexota bacterium]
MTVQDTPAPASRDQRRIVVALDGPASSGKSSVGAAAAERLGLRFVDTGLLYRALTALALREGVATDDAAGLVGLVGRIALADDGSGRLNRVLLDGEDASDGIRTDEVDAAVSAVARVPQVREALMPRQRALAADGGIVVAGRDIGTVVLPDADLKLFLDASVDERAGRRIEERGLDPAGEEAELVREQLRARDAQDAGRAVAPLRAADDAQHVRTDGNTLDQTIALVADAIAAAEGRPPAPGSKAEPTAEHKGDTTAEPKAERTPQPKAATATGTKAAAPPPATRRRNPLLDVAMRLDNDKSLLVRMVALVSRIGARLFANVRVEGLHRIPRTGAVILAANHISNADPVVVGAWITPGLRGRRIHWLGKKELFDWPGFGWLAAHGGVHPVDRSTADIEAYRLATRILEAGYVLLIFPEGTRSPGGTLQEAKDGLATLALRTGAAILPIGVNNSDAVWPKGRKLPMPFPRRTITVRIGEPFLAADLVPSDADRRAAKGIATAAIMRRIAEQLDERHRGVYAGAVRDESAPGA